MKIRYRNIWMAAAGLTAICALAAPQKKNVVDEVAWIVGDEPIFRSEIEEQYAQEQYGISGNPYCVIPEMLAVQKLYLHQAKIDTVTAAEGQVQSAVESRLNLFIDNLGSKEKVEEYFRKPMPSIRESLTEMIRNNMIIEQVQRKLTENIKATPNEVRKYFTSLPEDSIPYVPMQVETQIITVNPLIPAQEIEDVKARLREYSDRVNKCEVPFSTLAIMYSEDGSAPKGGELGWSSKADWVPEFANVAFNLNDPKKVSRIVETEFGYHIIQLIDKRGDKVNVRHILLTPKVSDKDLKDATVKLDSLRKEIVAGQFSFEEAAYHVSQDKDTRKNRGVMMNMQNGSSRFEMKDLPVEVARRVELMHPGDVSEAFIMKDVSKNKDVVALVKLTNRYEGHKANLADDFNLIKQMYEQNQKQKVLKEWVENKIKNTYVNIADGWKDCEFQFEGWVKDASK